MAMSDVHDCVCFSGVTEVDHMLLGQVVWLTPDHKIQNDSCVVLFDPLKYTDDE